MYKDKKAHDRNRGLGLSRCVTRRALALQRRHGDVRVGVGFIGLWVAVAHAIAEEVVHLFDGVLVGALGFHDLVEQRNVERHHGDGRAGLGDEDFVLGNPGFAAERGEFFITAWGHTT